MSGIDLKNHFSLLSSHDIQQICNEILSSIGISYFNYIKIYSDGSRELLTNNAPWIEHFYKNGLYKTSGVTDIEYLLPKGYFLWSELKNDDAAYSQGRESFNIDNGISFITKTTKSTTLYIFASTSDNHTINNFYVRNIDLLKRFILYFHDKAFSLITKSSQNKIYLPEKQLIHNRINEINITDEARENFINKTPINKFFILNKSDNVYLTKREAECAAYMLAGATAKQIAKKLSISFRTVESYFEKMKVKLNCPTKEDLIKFILETNIHDMLIT